MNIGVGFDSMSETEQINTNGDDNDKEMDDSERGNLCDGKRGNGNDKIDLA